MASKGKIIMDENSYRPLIKTIQATNWKVKTISPADKGTSDDDLLTKYGKGHFPILTMDTTMYKQNPSEGGATSFVVHDEAKPENMENLQVKVHEFFDGHTAKDLRKQPIWRIKLDK